MKNRLEGSWTAFLDAWDDEYAYPAAHRLEVQGRLQPGFTGLHFPEHHQADVAANHRLIAAYRLAGGSLELTKAILAGPVPRHRLSKAHLALVERWPR